MLILLNLVVYLDTIPFYLKLIIFYLRYYTLILFLNRVIIIFFI